VAVKPTGHTFSGSRINNDVYRCHGTLAFVERRHAPPFR
jgi:hypothetical protein